MSMPLRTEIKPETVEFKSRRDKQTLYFDLWNRGEQVQMYKIKSTNAKEFNIKPVFFSIELNERKRVTVTYLGKSKALTKDRITVVYGHQINLSTTVQQAWEDQRHLANISCVEKRKYVKISFKDDPVKRPEDPAQKSAMSSVMQNSATIAPLPASQTSGINRDQDSYFAVPPGGPVKVGQTAKKKGGSSRMEVKETTEDEAAAGNKKTSSSKTKKSVDTTRTEEATVDEGQQPAPPPAKPKTRRKVTNPPPPPPAAEEEEEAPAPPPKPVASKPKKAARPAAPTEAPASDEMADAPRAPSKKKSAPPKETEEDEEGEEAPPPPPTKTKKAGSRRKVHQPQPKETEDEEEEEAPPPVKPVIPARSKTGTRRKVMTVTPVAKRPPAPMASNDEDEATELDLKQKVAPVAPAAKVARTKPSPNSTPSKPKTKRKISGTTRTLDEIMKGGSMPEGSVIYVVTNERQEEDEEEEEKKTKKKSKENKKSGKKKKEESEEEEKEEEKE